MKTLLDLLPVIGWAALWGIGGWLLSLTLFRLRPAEAVPIGIGVGVVLETWVANLLAHVLPIDAASWASAILLCAAGGAAILRIGKGTRIAAAWRRWALLAALFMLF